jgi:hypothetical protein
MLVGSGLVGCGGSTSPVDPPPPPPSSPPLDFAPVAGDWVGTVSELRQPLVYPVNITLLSEASAGSRVGTVYYAGGLDCGGTLTARAVNDNSYEVGETITYGSGCVNNAIIQLTHDAAAGTLDYRWYSPLGPLSATAVLTRKE